MVRTQELEGRDHYVVPMVMLTVGEHSGSNGPVYYPADELRESVPAWNGKPVLCYHSQVHGRGVSASSPEIANKQKVGVIYNTSFDGTRLKADAWIDSERIRFVDERILQTIQLNQQMEVSTGLFMDYDDSQGGVIIARNYRPDHLAILPDLVGACSVTAGCGLLRNDSNDQTFDDEPLLTVGWM
ncbi:MULTISPECIES: DUF2213 domain-containing protein [Rhodopirellula]|uniref:DUF2213 domain-containing protein n=1 Tax=Rhodopirellula TaxID=265488 RepID=UPI00257D7ED5|nr:DUF2213 domain-containing protein [Rhodopirellula sp. UBA1907]